MKNVTACAMQRKSVRAFLPKPVDMAVLKELLQVASRSASGGNTQPWKLHVLTGAALADLKKVAKAKLPKTDDPEFEIYPSPAAEPVFLERRKKLGYDMYAKMNIERSDKIGRAKAMLKNFEFFDAPVGIIVTVHRACAANGWGHVGMFLETLALLCVERGLSSCFLEAWSQLNETVYQSLRIDKEKEVIWCGMAIGFEDTDAQVNTLVSERAPVDEFTKFYEAKL